jgi:DNA-binding MurR/RpiR family transcriptional regulator
MGMPNRREPETAVAGRSARPRVSAQIPAASPADGGRHKGKVTVIGPPLRSMPVAADAVRARTGDMYDQAVKASKENSAASLGGSSDLENRILDILEQLTQKQRRLARFILDHQIYVAFASAQDIGQEADVDAATVVRFSRRLGYGGFADLREEVRKSMPAFLTATEKVSRTLAVRGRKREIIDLIFSQDVENIGATANANSPEVLAETIRVLNKANEVYILGSGLSAPVASAFAHQLALIGVRSRALLGPFVQSAVEIAGVSSKDVVVGIGLWRYVRDTVALLAAGAGSGATTIAMTDTRMSPLARHAGIVLLGSTQTPEIPHSVTSLITLCNAISSGLALTNPSRTLRRLQRIDELYEASGLIVD